MWMKSLNYGAMPSRIRCLVCCGDCICCVRGCDRIATRSRLRGLTGQLLGRWGAPLAPTASAIAGVDQAPSEDDIVRLADSILSGAFVGDFAVALERAAAFTDVVALGLRVEARRMVTRAEANGAFSSDADEKAVRTKAARLMHTAGSLMATAKDFQHGANLWRRGRLE